MIQRVQSIYLLLVTLLMSFLILWPFAEVNLVDNRVFLFHAYAITVGNGTGTVVFSYLFPVLILVVIAALMSIVALFLYKRRKLQLKLCRMNTVVLFVLTIAIAFYYYRFLSSHDTLHHSLRLIAVNPLIAIIANTMAYQAIRHDEMLVNSYNRIR